jgi:MarR family transcriptional repressor of emrRAB
MSDFGPTEKRLRLVETRVPGFPVEQMLLVRMNYQLQKNLRDRTNAALKEYDLVDTGYMVLAILYGSPGETSTASELSEACYEKPANLTRVCDELVAKGLIERTPKPGDRRAVMISLSDQGRTLIERILPEVTAKVTTAYAGFSPAELRQQAEFHARALANLSAPE